VCTSLQKMPHPGVDVADKGGVVYTSVVLNSHEVWFCHGRIGSVGVETNILANVRSQQPKVPHLQPQLHVLTPIEPVFLPNLTE